MMRKIIFYNVCFFVFQLCSKTAIYLLLPILKSGNFSGIFQRIRKEFKLIIRLGILHKILLQNLPLLISSGLALFRSKLTLVNIQGGYFSKSDQITKQQIFFWKCFLVRPRIFITASYSQILQVLKSKVHFTLVFKQLSFPEFLVKLKNICFQLDLPN